MDHHIISFHYHLTDSKGSTLDKSENDHPLTFMTGLEQIIPDLEKELLILNPGDKKRVSIAAKDGYGEKIDELVITVAKEDFDADAKVGDEFKDGREEDSPAFRVLQITDTHVVLDANHPLAGVDLTFDVEIISKRQPSKEELEHGHAHGEDGHHHH